MKYLYKLLRQDPYSREGVITTTSALGLLINVVVSVIKIMIGIAVSSIAIVSEGTHSAADAATSILSIVGVRLANKRPTKKHPFGYGRIEYLTGLAIALLILVTGFEMLTASIDLIFRPAELQISSLTLVIIAASAVVKYALGVYTIKKGESIDSQSLIGLGVEGRNDSYASVITILSAIVFLVSGYSIDAYAGVLTSVLILKTGSEILLSTASDLLGRSGNQELAETLYREIRSTEGILNAADMMLHNYGPDAYSASVNIEIDHAKTIGEIYEHIHELQLRIMHDYHVTMVFGIYAVDNQTESSRRMRTEIADFVRSHEHVISYHALYHDQKQNRIYCDFVVDYEDFDWDALKAEFSEYMRDRYPECTIHLVVETEFV